MCKRLWLAALSLAEWQALLASQASTLAALLSWVQTAAATLRQRGLQPGGARRRATLAGAGQASQDGGGEGSQLSHEAQASGRAARGQLLRLFLCLQAHQSARFRVARALTGIARAMAAMSSMQRHRLDVSRTLSSWARGRRPPRTSAYS